MNSESDNNLTNVINNCNDPMLIINKKNQSLSKYKNDGVINNPNSVTSILYKKNKQKPLSMNETMLNKIVKDSIQKHNISKKIIPEGHLSMTKSNSKNKSFAINVQTKIKNKFPINYNLKHNDLKAGKDNSQINNTKNTTTQSKKSSSNSLSNLAMVSNIPMPNKLIKMPSNGIEHCSSNRNNTLNSEMSLGLFPNNDKIEKELNLTINSHKETAHNNFPIPSSRSFHTDTFKLNEELLQFKLNNSKLSNEISILKEKIKTLKGVNAMKNAENEMIRTKYTEIIDDYKREIDKTKKINNEYNSIKSASDKSNIYIRSTISVLIDLLDIFISPRYSNTNMYTRQSINAENISASYSMDIYDSYNNDEERRFTIIDQIQGLLVAKLNVMKKNMNLDLDKEIERVKNWNAKPNKEEINMSNLNFHFKIPKMNESSESFKKSISNDFFDLSTSNQYITGNLSPKFNNDDLSGAFKIRNSSIGNSKDNKDENYNPLNAFNSENNLSLKKEYENLMVNDSFLKDLKQNDSFSDDKNGSLVIGSNTNFNPFYNTNEKEKKKEKFEMNIIDCSIIDLNVDSKFTPKDRETKMLFNDDPTEFNLEMNILPQDDDLNSNNNIMNTTFQNEEEIKEGDVNLPIILKPIVNTELTQNFLNK